MIRTLCRKWDSAPCGAHVLAQRCFLHAESGVALFAHEGFADKPSHGPAGAARARRWRLFTRALFAEPNIPARAPGTPEDLSGALADPEPLFAAPTRLDRIGRVMTHVMVNGKGPFRFVIDTGASRSTLAPHLARALGPQAFGGPQRHAQRRHRRRRSAHGRRRQHRDRRAAGSRSRTCRSSSRPSWATPTASSASPVSRISASTSTSSATA